MPSLRKVQEQFKDLMLDHPDAVYELDQEFTGQFEKGGVVLPERLKIYRNNIVGSLTDVMIAHFPVTQKLVGEAFFKGMARSYILKNPPKGGCLNIYGQDFYQFVAKYEPAKGLKYLPDVAKMEAALNAAYYAPDEVILRPQDLAEVEDLETASIGLQAHVSLIASDYALTEIRRFCALREEDQGRLEVYGRECVLVFREDLQSHARPIPPWDFMMLRYLQDGLKLGEAVEKTMSEFERFDFNAFLPYYLSLGIFKVGVS